MRSLNVMRLSGKGKTQARDDRIESGKPVQKGDEIGHVKVSHQREVPWVAQKILIIFWLGPWQRLLVRAQGKQRRWPSDRRVGCYDFRITFCIGNDRSFILSVSWGKRIRHYGWINVLTAVCVGETIRYVCIGDDKTAACKLRARHEGLELRSCSNG